jgi:hypothetical protein
MELIGKWEDFRAQVAQYINEVDEFLLENETQNTQKGYVNILKYADAWIYKCYNYLKKAFNSANNEFAQSFYTAKQNSSYIKVGNKENRKLFSDLFEELKAKRKSLEHSLRLLAVSDAIIQPDKSNLMQRQSYSLDEIVELLLDKLYHLDDEFYYLLRTLLRGNGIEVENPDKLVSIAKLLEKKGYAKAIYIRSVKVQLSLEGRKFVEEKKHSLLYDQIESDEAEVVS